MHTQNLKLYEWLLFQIMVRNPGRTDARTDTRTDGRSPFLCPLPTSSTETKITLIIVNDPLMLGECLLTFHSVSQSVNQSVSQSVSHLLTQVPNTHPPIILPRQVLHYRPLHWGIMGGITLSFSWWWILNTFRTDCVLVKVHLYP